MKLLRATAVVLLAMTTAFSSACKKKKPNIPAASTPPTVTVPETKPTQPANPPATTTTTPPEPTPTTSGTATTTTTTPPKPKPKKKVAHKPKPQAPPAQPTQQQQSAKNTASGSATGNGEGMTISPDLPKDEVVSQKRATEQMLQNAETNLRTLTRQLSDGEQSMARQVRNYITQSRLATQDGDLERAHNLAVKAQLLSSELTK
jgi:outer membrane biosynthesis protein TonB